MMNLLDNAEVRQVLVPDADRFTGTVNSDAVSLAYWDHVTFIVQIGTVTSTGRTKITVEKGTSKAMSTPVAIGFRYRTATSTGAWSAPTAVAAATGYTPAASSNQMVAIEVDAAELGDGYTHVWLDAVESVDNPIDAAVLAILTKSRFDGIPQRISLS